MDAFKIERDRLYEEIWAEPVRTVAKRYGISDVALAKICRKLDVPRPPLGYWSRKEHGYAVERAPLPPVRPGVSTVATISPPSAKPRLSGEMRTRLAEVGNDRVSVKSRLHNPHPLVAATADTLRASKKNALGLLTSTPRRSHLDIRVAQKSVERALRIMDALIRALERKGFTVAVNDKGRTQIELLGEKLSISMDEPNRQVAHVLTAEERDRQQRYPLTSIPKWDFQPTGLLRFRINEWGGEGARKTWIDGRRQRLEDMLDDVVVGLVTFAEAERRAREERERQRLEWEAERARQAELERRRREEEARRQELEHEAEVWARAKNLRNYVEAVACQAKMLGLGLELGTELRCWLDWARQQADALDPIRVKFGGGC